MSFNIIDFIERKRDGGANSPDDVAAFVAGVRDGAVADYQASAWLMAVCLRGLEAAELRAFTDALASSGDKVELPAELRAVDKHSTGGVGDKTTLIVAPLVAACGATVAKLSGRGLGFTGGTVDKLESIRGMNVHLDPASFIRQVNEIGCAISGHSLKLAPAEGKFYALRDVTGTVPSLPLIASSIVSKKIAGGASAFVFDVKCGSGAFMPGIEEARALARALVDLSREMGRRAVCVISDMEQPLGEWVGNSVEVMEAIDVLAGGGPADTRELSIALSAEMLAASGVAADTASAREMCEAALANGSALGKFARVVETQGGDPQICGEPEKHLPFPKLKRDISVSVTGVLGALDARAVGEAIRALGGGRMKKEDEIDPSAFIHVLKKIGDPVEADEPILEVGYNDPARFESALPHIERAISIRDGAEPRTLILDLIS